jgi:hypothetical protein
MPAMNRLPSIIARENPGAELNFGTGALSNKLFHGSRYSAFLAALPAPQKGRASGVSVIPLRPSSIPGVSGETHRRNHHDHCQ